jgi:hypothetical protein
MYYKTDKIWLHFIPIYLVVCLGYLQRLLNLSTPSDIKTVTSFIHNKVVGTEEGGYK